MFRLFVFSWAWLFRGIVAMKPVTAAGLGLTAVPSFTFRNGIELLVLRINAGFVVFPSIFFF